MFSVPPFLDDQALTASTDRHHSDASPTLSTALQVFTSRHPSPVTPTTADMSFLRALASHVSRRSASVVAASLFALWELKAEAEREFLSRLGDATSPFAADTAAELELLAAAETTVAFNGSVIENYPGYRRHLQAFIDALVAGSECRADGKGGCGSVVLVEARESSLLGAAVALACLA